MAPRSDGAAYALEAVVNEDNCVSCGICVGACPTATPFRRATAVVPGIELPEHRIADLREQSLKASDALQGDTRIIVYACAQAGAEKLHQGNVAVVSMPCLGMLPPAFVDFVLSRRLADGVMLAGCAEEACFHRLGNTWTQQRVDGERDPYLRKRVPRDRLAVSWLPQGSARQTVAVNSFAKKLGDLPPVEPRRRSVDG
jgi:coenzyme F420-reducing hydrogenase delta subunit/ferredoxin